MSGALPTCTKCGGEHERYRDAAHAKPAAYCKGCHAGFMRLNRPRYSEMSDEQRVKVKARAYANVYQRRGVLVQKPCECCGDPNAEKHHEDYSQPLLVRWLCRKCHMGEHFMEAIDPRGTISCEKLAA